MHELGIVFHVIKTVERVGAENDLTRVAGVTLELGEVCGCHPKGACQLLGLGRAEIRPAAGRAAAH